MLFLNRRLLNGRSKRSTRSKRSKTKSLNRKTHLGRRETSTTSCSIWKNNGSNYGSKWCHHLCGKRAEGLNR